MEKATAALGRTDLPDLKSSALLGLGASACVCLCASLHQPPSKFHFSYCSRLPSLSEMYFEVDQKAKLPFPFLLRPFACALKVETRFWDKQGGREGSDGEGTPLSLHCSACNVGGTGSPFCAGPSLRFLQLSTEIVRPGCPRDSRLGLVFPRVLNGQLLDAEARRAASAEGTAPRCFWCTRDSRAKTGDFTSDWCREQASGVCLGMHKAKQKRSSILADNFGSENFHVPYLAFNLKEKVWETLC